MNQKQGVATTSAARCLQKLLEPGLLGQFTWFDSVEIFAVPIDGGLPWNVFSLFVAEEGDIPSKKVEPQIFLNNKPKELKGLKGWKFGIKRESVPTTTILGALETLEKSNQWPASNGKGLRLGLVKFDSSTFCPTDGTHVVPFNKALKNNYWNGSHLIELKDTDKAGLKFLIENGELRDELTAWIKTLVPIDLHKLYDKIGNIVIQIPVAVLSTNAGSTKGGGYGINSAWRPDTNQRSLIGNYRVDNDGLVVNFGQALLENGQNILVQEHTGGAFTSTVWDADNDLLLAATSPTLYMGMGGFSMSTSAESSEPRIFKVIDSEGSVESHHILVMQREPFPSQGNNPQPKNWQRRRTHENEMAELLTSLRFIQYANKPGDRKESRRKSMRDIRRLLEKHGQYAAYLWDPYLCANDILNTLAHCSHGGAEFRALTSSKPSSLKNGEDTGASGEDSVTTEEITRRKTWQQTQSETLNEAFTGSPQMCLQFRGSWGIPGGAFHDRFLIFPGHQNAGPRVWSLGASLNHLGSEHAIVQEISFAQPVVDAFNGMWSRTFAMEDGKSIANPSIDDNLIWSSQ